MMDISEELGSYQIIEFSILSNLPYVIKYIQLSLIPSLSLEAETPLVKHLVKIRESVASKSYPTRHQSVKYLMQTQ